ncbi:MAG: glucose-6-phosphate isomerase family protein [Patescibacteria group bacterium]
MENLAVRTHQDMQDVVMVPGAPGPAVHYYMIRGGSKKRNITVWESGTVGGEYIKTYGHYHVGDLDETYKILEGEGIALLQKLVEENGVPVIDRVEEFKAIKVSAKGGSASGGKAVNSVYMPPGYGHLVVNTGKTWLVTSDDSPVFGATDSISKPGHADYEPVKKMRGFAYYVVEKNSAPALVRNPLYKEVRKMDSGGLNILDS